MFFFHKPKVEAKEIKGYKQAIKAIKIYIALEEWEKCYKGIKEIELKEKKAYGLLMRRLSDNDVINDNVKGKHIKEYNAKVKELETLKEKAEAKEKEYEKKMKKNRFQIRFKKIKEEVKNSIKTDKASEALLIITNFLEENKDNTKVIKFYNKQKIIIQKVIEKKKKIEEKKMESNVGLEAANLVGDNKGINTEQKEKKSFFNKLIDKLSFYKKLKKKIENNKLFNEVHMLIDEEDKAKKNIAREKLANIHKGLVKELKGNNIVGYDLYGKILGADKVSGDTFGYMECEDGYKFFLGDATGHGVKAGFIVTLLSRIFNDHAKKSTLEELAYEINNGLKQSLESRNFITGVLFEIKKIDKNTLRYVGMGHEPMFIFREEQKIIEKVVPGGLAAGIRLIKELKDIRVKEVNMGDNDILVIYSDGFPEAKDITGEYYGIEKFKNSFQRVSSMERNLKNIYDYMLKELNLFQGGSNYLDDTTILLLKRDLNKEIIKKNNDFIKDLKEKEGLDDNTISKFEGKTKDEVLFQLDKMKKEREIKGIVKSLENLYFSGEVLKLKEEAIRFIKEGFIDKKINYYLKKAIENENNYRIEQKEMKMQNKYNVLKELYKKGDYSTVIRESENIILRDGKI